VKTHSWPHSPLPTVFLALGFSAFALAVPAAAQDYALERLEASPRHHEWAKVKSGERTVHCFVAYPEKSEKTAVVVVIHENRGLTDWVRSFADQLAEAGYLAVAPDLLSGFDEKHDQTSDFANSDAARDAIYKLDADQVTADLRAVRAYAAGLPAAKGKPAVAGFCWGGSQSFRFATNSKEIAAALVFYGSPPDSAALGRIAVPVYGFYGGDDARINATIEPTQERMKALEKSYEPVVYDGAGHAYMRRGDAPDAEAVHKKARDASWVRLRKILAGL
jgi:carboxymethylenebutenolidase